MGKIKELLDVVFELDYSDDIELEYEIWLEQQEQNK